MNNGVRVRQLVPIDVRHQAIRADDPIEFFVQLALDVLGVSEVRKAPLESGAGRFLKVLMETICDEGRSQPKISGQARMFRKIQECLIGRSFRIRLILSALVDYFAFDNSKFVFFAKVSFRLSKMSSSTSALVL